MTKAHAKKLIQALRAALDAQANTERAQQQQAYMKSTMAYAGLTSPQLRSLCKELFNEHPMDSATSWFNCAEQMWNQATVREERYAAIALLAVPRYRKQWYDPSCLPLYRHMIETGAWWDYVDNIASNHVGELWLRFDDAIQTPLESWIDDPHLWVRRTTILAQIKFKHRTDLDFMHRAIQGSIHDKDFFARKAIGWALRAYSYTDPEWVIGYIEQHESELSPLSIREGMKVIRRKATQK